MTQVINAKIKNKTVVPDKSNSVNLCEGDSVLIVVGRKTERDYYMLCGTTGGLVVAAASLFFGVLDRLEICTVSDMVADCTDFK